MHERNSFKTGQCAQGLSSTVATYRQIIEEKIQQGLDATRIQQDLCSEHGFGGCYGAVKRFVRKLRQANPEAFARVETLPGKEADVDFGTAAPTLDASTGR